MSFILSQWLEGQRQRAEMALKERALALRSSTPPLLFEAMVYSLLDGGKRLRPLLCFAWADETARASLTTEILDDAACSLEFVHTYSLIHDDLPPMDNDDVRRGRPTSHIVYGEAGAILAGDALLTEAFALLARTSTVERGRLVSELAVAAGARGMVGGQMLDIAHDRPSELDYLVRLHRMKTGALIRAACRMGVLAAGGSDDVLSAATVYGEAVGLAFQIADDILDVTQSAAVMGKPTRADVAAGRPTFPALLGLEEARALAQRQVEEAVVAARSCEGADGPLQALARYAIDRER